MFRRKPKSLIFLLLFAVCFYLLSFPMNHWLSATMPRHQLLQLPAMFLVGALIALLVLKPLKVSDLSWRLAGLIFVMASLIFWMLPHSVDLSAINPFVNNIRHLNLLLAGFLTITLLRHIIVEVKILFLSMLASMLLAVGITLRVFDVLLCSSFNITEQKQTGLILIFAGIFLFLYTLVVFFRMPAQMAKRALNA